MASAKDFDPYALTATEFSHQSRSKFSVCWTLVATVIVLIISLIISFSAIKNIWIPRNELQISLSQQSRTSKPLTKTPICLSFDQHFIPQHSIKNSLNQTVGRKMSQIQLLNFFPEMLTDIGNRTYVCYDLEGVVFIPDLSYVQFNVRQSNTIIHLKTYDLSQIFQQSTTPIVNISMNVSIYNTQIEIQLIQTTIYDSPFQNQITQIINSIQYSKAFIKKIKIQQNLCLNCNDFFFIISNKQTPPILQVTLFRLTIGVIVGIILSWISIIFTLFAIFVIPYLQLKLSVSIIKETFKLPKDISQKPNLLKIFFAKFIKGVFEQDLYSVANQKLDKYKDVVSLLYFKEIVSKLYKRPLYVRQKQVNKIIYHKTNELQIDNIYEKNIIENQQKSKNIIMFEKDSKSNIKQKIISIIKWFDLGTDSISINYSHEGYRSNKSLIITILAFLFLFLFFYYIGVFTIATQTLKSDLIVKNNATFAFDSKTVFFILQPSTNNDSIQAFYLNSKQEIINQVVLLKGENCINQKNYAIENNLTMTNYSIFYCFPPNIRLSTKGIEKFIALKINIKQIQLLGSFNLVKINYNYDNNQINTNLISTQFSFFLIQYKIKFLLTFLQINQDNTVSKFIEWNFPRLLLLQPQAKYNMYFEVGQKLTKIQTKTITVFDMINNVWGLTTICFTYILLKLNTFLNKRQIKTDIDKQHEKISFPNFLQKINLLSQGLQRHELQIQKKFIKKQMIV